MRAPARTAASSSSRMPRRRGLTASTPCSAWSQTRPTRRLSTRSATVTRSPRSRSRAMPSRCWRKRKRTSTNGTRCSITPNESGRRRGNASRAGAALWAGAIAAHEVIDHEQDDRADNRAHEAGALAGLVPVEFLAEPGRHERSDDAYDRGDDETTGIAAGRQKLGDDADDQADDERHEDAVGTAEYFHCESPRLVGNTVGDVRRFTQVRFNTALVVPAQGETQCLRWVAKALGPGIRRDDDLIQQCAALTGSYTARVAILRVRVRRCESAAARRAETAL